ncbi:MAG: transglycosylase SLT domain-containing protein [Bacteriovoracaceae bacterium]|nr:transglycosylase SLT domain-containing protein [Bacteriovoracaceae bacterium]
MKNIYKVKTGYTLFTRIIFFIVLICLLSCATGKKEIEKIQLPESNYEIATSADISGEHGDKKDSPERIVGSSKIEKPEQVSKKTYFLFGAEHLNLDNYYFDIPVVYNKAVKKWIRYFLNRGRGFFKRYSARAGRYAPILGKILEEHGLPRDLIFLAMAESGFQNKAKSWAKAVGPWQFMPYTGKTYGLKIDWYIDERRDPIKATIAASKYLKKLYGDFGAWELASAAYNAGEGKMSRAIKRYKTENFWKIRRGRYLKSETKNYVPKIMALAIIGKNLRSFGFEEIDFHEPLDFEEVIIPPFTDLIEVSQKTGIDFSELHRLNPEILRWFSPPDREYILRVPVGYSKVWMNCCNGKNLTASAFQKYRIRGKNATLRQVAKKFKIKKNYVLEQLNGHSSKKKLKRNQSVILPFRIGQSRRDSMYADLYERPRKSVVRRRQYRSRIKLARIRGKRIHNPVEYYVVRRGDTLWSVAIKKGISLDTLIRSNLNLVRNRMIREGDKLVVR